MLTFFGPSRKCRGDVSRRDVLRVGGLALGGLTLADVLRLRADAATARMARGKSVIMIWLRGGPSHIDSYDMKPDAPAEIRGEFKPIATNVPGIQICEHLPRHAQMMDKLAIVRGIQSNDLGDHTPHYILTGFPDRGKRPVLRVGRQLPAAADGRAAAVRQPDVRAAGPVRQRRPDLHRPGAPAVRPEGEGLANLSLAKGVSLDRLRRPPRSCSGSSTRSAARSIDDAARIGGHRRLHAAGAGDDRVAEGARGVRPEEGAGRRRASGTASSARTS